MPSDRLYTEIGICWDKVIALSFDNENNDDTLWILVGKFAFRLLHLGPHDTHVGERKLGSEEQPQNWELRFLLKGPQTQNNSIGAGLEPVTSGHRHRGLACCATCCPPGMTTILGDVCQAGMVTPPSTTVCSHSNCCMVRGPKLIFLNIYLISHRL